MLLTHGEAIMGKRYTNIIGILFFVFLSGPLGCYQYNPSGPVPEAKHQPAERAWTPEQVDGMVVMEEVAIFSPAPKSHGEPPPECDYIRFLRFRLRDSSGDPNDADAMLVMIPGILEGANGFEYIGRQLLYVAKTRNDLDLEVWAFDRRNNCLEDLTGVEKAEVTPNLDTAIDLSIDYYYLGGEVDGRTFDGFLTNADLPFLSEFGLKMDTEDIFTIIQTMVPDPEMRRQKVFVGGHSLGGIHTSMFAGWDLDGNPETLDDAGYMNCAGLFGFDTIVTATTEVIAPLVNILPEFIFGLIEDMTEYAYVEIVQMLRSRTVSPILPFPFFTSEVMALVESVGMLAHRAPDTEHTAIHRVPYSGDVDMVLKLFHSRTLDHFTNHVPAITDFRFTNEALLGILFDDDFAPVGMIQTSLGHLNGGTLVKKDFPIPSAMAGIPILSDLASLISPIGNYFIAGDAGPAFDDLGKGPLYTWANFDEIGNSTDPEYRDLNGKLTYTTMTEEVTDIQDFARTLYKGPSNLTEWYFSTRRIIDIMAATLSYGPKYGLNFLHADQVGSLPSIEFIAADGVLDSGTLRLFPGEYKPITGFNHMDPMMAAADRPGHRENDVIPPLIDFIQNNI